MKIPKLTKPNNMKELDNNIKHFIKKHHVFNIVTYNNDEVWTASCFYAFWEEDISLVFLSDEDTLHAKLMSSNPKVVGTITLETKIIGKIQGLQFKGTVSKAENELLSVAKRIYYKRFPYTIGTQSTFWLLKIIYAKYTDNKLGFGKKIIWQLNETQNPFLK